MLMNRPKLQNQPKNNTEIASKVDVVVAAAPVASCTSRERMGSFDHHVRDRLGSLDHHVRDRSGSFAVRDRLGSLMLRLQRRRPYRIMTRMKCRSRLSWHLDSFLLRRNMSSTDLSSR
jgi:hypothetical protein